MKRKKGFTLIELLAVIVLLGLLMAIAIPSALKLSAKVKGKAYQTKIDLIEQAAANYGQSNLSFVKRGTDPNNTNNHYTCKMTYTGDNITKVDYQRRTAGYSETAVLANNEYWCMRVFVEDLVKSNNLDYDEKGTCGDHCTAANKPYYDNVVINPSTNYIINKCYVYVYYKYNRVYTVFDDDTCNIKSETPNVGHEYRQIS